MQIFHISFIVEGNKMLQNELTKEQWIILYGFLRKVKDQPRTLEELLHIFNNGLRINSNIIPWIIEWGILSFFEEYLKEKEKVAVDPFIFGVIGNINMASDKSLLLIEKHPGIVKAMFANVSFSRHPGTIDATLFCIRKLTTDFSAISKPLLSIGGEAMAADMKFSHFKEVRDYGEILTTRLKVSAGQLPNTSHPCGNPKCTNIGTKLCSRCRHTRYCSRECQAMHWKSGDHRKVCDLYTNVEKEMHGKDVKNFQTTSHHYILNHFGEIRDMLKKAKLGYQQVVVKLDLEAVSLSPKFDYWKIDDFYNTVLDTDPYNQMKGTLERFREQLSSQTIIVIVRGDNEVAAKQIIIPPGFSM
jgi:hypothetical protein